jgi:hypothetical protein
MVITTALVLSISQTPLTYIGVAAMCGYMKRSKSLTKLAAYVRAAQRYPANFAPPGFTFSLTAFALAIGVSRQMLRMWMLGAVTPDRNHRRKLEEITNGSITSSGWDD